MDENAGNASPRPKFGPAMSGDLIDADDTTTGSRGGGTGFDDNGEGNFNTHIPQVIPNGGYRHLVQDGGLHSLYQRTREMSPFGCKRQRHRRESCYVAGKMRTALLGMSSNTKLDMHLNSDAEVTRIESGHGKLERLAHGLKSSKTKANIV
ncbi:hypothetical protein N7504_011119 [Penicillium tannophilum]|nr:hypothetical protein N7504_011119 [Penicillium tannophilum]